MLRARSCARRRGVSASPDGGAARRRPGSPRTRARSRTPPDSARSSSRASMSRGGSPPRRGAAGAQHRSARPHCLRCARHPGRGDPAGAQRTRERHHAARAPGRERPAPGGRGDRRAPECALLARLVSRAARGRAERNGRLGAGVGGPHLSGALQDRDRSLRAKPPAVSLGHGRAADAGCGRGFRDTDTARPVLRQRALRAA